MISASRIILRYVCWGNREARWLTARPAVPLGLGQRSGGGGAPPPLRRGGLPPPPPPPSTTPETVEHPSGSNPGWEQPPCFDSSLLWGPGTAGVMVPVLFLPISPRLKVFRKTIPGIQLLPNLAHWCIGMPRN